MGGLRKRYANKPLTTFAETLEAFLTGVSYRFFCWLQNNRLRGNCLEVYIINKNTEN